VSSSQQPLAQILARNLLASIALPGLLVDEEGALVFFNGAAGELIGRRFEEVGQLSREEWAVRFGPFGQNGEPIALDSLPLALTIREGRPAQGRFSIRTTAEDVEIDVSALPLVGEDGFHGALVAFWRPGEDAGQSG